MPILSSKHDFLLPHIRLNKDMRYCSGVNSPEKFCMEFHTCEYVFKVGKTRAIRVLNLPTIVKLVVIV